MCPSVSFQQAGLINNYKIFTIAIDMSLKKGVQSMSQNNAVSAIFTSRICEHLVEV